MDKHIFRHLRPCGLPIILESHYHPHSGKILAVYEYPLSPELDEPEARMGEVQDFTMDSLRNQIIQKPRKLSESEVRALGFEDIKH